MVTIAHITKQILRNKPFVHEALEKELINLGALADYIKPEIEKELGVSVKTTAVSMAIRRYVENSSDFLKKVTLTSKSDLLVKSNLFEISLHKTGTLYKKIIKLYDVVDFSKGDTLNIIHGNHETLIVINEKYKDEVERLFNKGEIISKRGDISSISVKIPSEHVVAPGFYYAITKALAIENISIIDIVNTTSEATLILDDKDIPRAYSILKNEISVNYYK